MSPTRSSYQELGIELVKLREEHSRQPRQPPMVEEKLDDGEVDPIKWFLKESLI
jgi:hypothetical protein